MGRPPKEINMDQLEKLCGMQCTLSEIAGFFECSEDTIERRVKSELGMTFADAFKKYSAPGKISLRRTQFRLAEKNAAMAIFLGKNYLGQKDNPDFNVDETLKRLDDVLKQINGVENAVQ